MSQTLKAEQSELGEHLDSAHPFLQKYVVELQQEIEQLQRQNAKQEVAHLSATAKMKVKHEQELLNISVIAKGLSPEEAYDAMLRTNGEKRS